MRCLRCGRCCFTHSVVIVDDPELGPSEDNLIFRIGGERCKHLVGEAPPYSCAIHDQPWFPETPCGTHGQIERSPDAPCRLGVFVLRGELSV